jgi:hypothetical protein
MSSQTDSPFTQAGEREPELRELDKIIRETAPSLKPSLMKESMYGDMLAYGMMPYQSKSMKEPGEWPLLALKAQKNYISLYACVVVDDKYISEKYQPTLGKVSCGKSCIRFKKVSDLNLDSVRQMLAEINSRHVAGEKIFIV